MIRSAGWKESCDLHRPGTVFRIEPDRLQMILQQIQSAFERKFPEKRTVREKGGCLAEGFGLGIQLDPEAGGVLFAGEDLSQYPA